MPAYWPMAPEHGPRVLSLCCSERGHDLDKTTQDVDTNSAVEVVSPFGATHAENAVSPAALVETISATTRPRTLGTEVSRPPYPTSYGRLCSVSPLEAPIMPNREAEIVWAHRVKKKKRDWVRPGNSFRLQVK